MARVKGGVNAKKNHKKILKQAKGYYGSKHTLYRTAKQAVIKSLSYSYVGRKQRKRQFRQLWIARINAACRANRVNYSTFMHGLKEKDINLNRKVLSEMAIHQPEDFKNLIEMVR